MKTTKFYRPTKLRIEAGSRCQLKCPLCPTANKQLDSSIIGWLNPNNLEKLLVNNIFIEEVELSNWGEIFLNPHIDKIFKIGHDCETKLTIGNGVNLNTASAKALKALVKYQVDFMIISIDGVTQESYEKYRIKGILSKVLKNINIINDWKLYYKTKYPKLIWKFIVFGHNVHEINKAKKMAKDLDMEFMIKRSWDASWSPIKNPQETFKKTGKLPTPEAIQEEQRPTGWDLCLQVWETPQISWNGDLLGCCANRGTHIYGNVFKENLITVLKSKAYDDLKEVVIGQKEKDSHCNNCWRYTHHLSMNKDGRLLEIVNDKFK